MKPDRYGFCPSCGVPYIEHMGLIGTCADLQRERRATLEAAGAIAGYIEEVRRLREALESTLEENTVLIRALERIAEQDSTGGAVCANPTREALIALNRSGGK